MNADKIVEELTFGELWWLMSSLPQDSLPEWGSLLSSGIFRAFLQFCIKKSVKIPMFVQVLIFLVILLRIALLIGLCCGVLLAEPACLGWLARKLYFDGTASNPAFIHVGRWPGSAQKLLDFFLWHL